MFPWQVGLLPMSWNTFSWMRVMLWPCPRWGLPIWYSFWWTCAPTQLQVTRGCNFSAAWKTRPFSGTWWPWTLAASMVCKSFVLCGRRQPRCCLTMPSWTWRPFWPELRSNLWHLQPSNSREPTVVELHLLRQTARTNPRITSSVWPSLLTLGVQRVCLRRVRCSNYVGWLLRSWSNKQGLPDCCANVSLFIYG